MSSQLKIDIIQVPNRIIKKRGLNLQKKMVLQNTVLILPKNWLLLELSQKIYLKLIGIIG